jgi:hypothetical protein
MQPDQPNVGLKLTAEQVAQGIRSHELGEKMDDAVLDPSAFAQSGGPSIAERMEMAKVLWRAADNKRVGKLGAMGGWDQLRARLVGTCQRDDKGQVLWDSGNPLLLFFSTCTHTIRTLPALQHDELKPEDVDTEAEDHAPDETRYACMSRPIVHDAPDARPPKYSQHRTIDELIRAQTRKRLQLEA